MVECQRRSDRGVTSETRYFISSLPPPASTLLAAVRGHGSIENSMPWVLDVALREDDSCVRRDQAPTVCCLLLPYKGPRRRIALNVLKQEQNAKVGIAHKRLQAGWHQNYIFKLLEIMLQGNLIAIALGTKVPSIIQDISYGTLFHVRRIA